MKLIIEIPDWQYKSICEGVEASKRCGVVGIDPDIHEAIANGTPCETDGDSISRKYVKEHIPELLSHDDCIDIWIKRFDVEDLIDNAPTVKPCENCDLYFKAMTKEEMRKGADMKGGAE